MGEVEQGWFPVPSIHENRKFGQGLSESVMVRRTFSLHALLTWSVKIRSSLLQLQSALGALGFISLSFRGIDFLFSN